MLINFLNESDGVDITKAINQTDAIYGENILMKAIELNNELV